MDTLIQVVPHTCPGEEEIAVLVKGDGHHAICQIERLLYAISMVNININVEDSWMVLQELQYRYDDVVHVAESRGFKLLGMMETTRPINSHITALRGRGGGVVAMDMIM